jgi:DNA (cytosine-5)-methyltransferase 1
VRAGSLFSGIGGLDLGLERAGMTIAWQVEIKPFSRQVLAKHWPNVPRWGDIREVNPDELPRADLVCAGFPCQDVSDAGRLAGIEGKQSGLWAEVARLVRALRPRYLLVENVAGLLARGMGRVLGDLADVGYDAEWDCLPAAAVGAPHLRPRVWLLAYPAGQRGGAWHQDQTVLAGRLATDGGAGWAPEPRVARVADGVSTRLDRARLYTTGDAVVPQVAEHVGRLILAADLVRREADR